MSTIDRMKNNEIKIIFNYLHYNNINYYNLNNNNNYIMIKLWLKISHMSFMNNEWNVPHHWNIIMPHHVLNDYYFWQLVRNDFRVISHFSFLWLEYQS